MAPRPAHELEAAEEPRWRARFKDGLLMVTDLASEEEFQATAYTHDGNAIRFSLPGDNGLRVLQAGQPGYEDFTKVLGATPLAALVAGTSPRRRRRVKPADPAPEKEPEERTEAEAA